METTPTARPREDAQLLGDRDGLRVLYERHFDAVFRYVAARIGRQAAEDVVAETFAIAFTRRAAFDRRHASALPWLIGIAANLLRSRRRAERRHLAACRAGSDVALETENGVERRTAPQLFGTWRAVVPGAEVVHLPAERDALLAALRTRAAAAADRNPYPLLDRQIELSGRDLIVVDGDRTAGRRAAQPGAAGRAARAAGRRPRLVPAGVQCHADPDPQPRFDGGRARP